jgi:hypothetical protein
MESRSPGAREAGFRFLLPVSKISKWPRLGLLDIRHDWFRYTLLLIVHPRLRTLGNLGGLYQDAESESRTVHEMSVTSRDCFPSYGWNRLYCTCFADHLSNSARVYKHRKELQWIIAFALGCFFETPFHCSSHSIPRNDLRSP